MNPIDALTPGFGDFQFSQSDLEEFLGRKSVGGISAEVKEAYAGRKVLVTGAAGSIGSELSNQLLNCDLKELLLLDQSETGLYHLIHELHFEEAQNNLSITPVLCDLTNEHSVARVFSKYQPEVVLHAAAYKHVPMMEEHPFESINTNIFGSMALANLAVKHEVEKFVFISTDKAVNPANVMGACKRAVELLMNTLNLTSGTRFYTTRFGNVINSAGSAVSLFQRQVQKGKPITLTDPKMTRYFMTTHEACTLVLESGVFAEGGEIFVFDMGKPIKILDLVALLLRVKVEKKLDEVEVDFIGLRPGEKLHEELLFPHEKACPTSHPKIQEVNVKQASKTKVLEMLGSIKEAYDADDEIEMIRQLKQLVPEYKSKVSRFSLLD